MADTLNGVLDRLKAAFDAERSFAANAAHELRTPLAGAIAQAQRLRSETSDPAAEARAAEIEATLKRLTRLSERLMQLARAEGGRLRLDRTSDLRTVARVVVEDIGRTGAPGRIALTLPETPVMSDLDPDAFGNTVSKPRRERTASRLGSRSGRGDADAGWEVDRRKRGARPATRNAEPPDRPLRARGRKRPTAAGSASPSSPPLRIASEARSF